MVTSTATEQEYVEVTSQAQLKRMSKGRQIRLEIVLANDNEPDDISISMKGMMELLQKCQRKGHQLYAIDLDQYLFTFVSPGD